MVQYICETSSESQVVTRRAQPSGCAGLAGSVVVVWCGSGLQVTRTGAATPSRAHSGRSQSGKGQVVAAAAESLGSSAVWVYSTAKQ